MNTSAAPSARPVTVTAAYRIAKHGLYAYQLERFNPAQKLWKPIGEPNVYGVIASDMAERMIGELSGEVRK